MSLFQLQKDALISDLKRFHAAHRHLIVDDSTYPIVEKLFEDDVLNFVYTFKKIDGERSKNRESAIYLLDPTRLFSLECLKADFKYGQRYKDVVVMFMPGFWQRAWEELLHNQYFTRSLVEMKEPVISDYLSFIPMETHVFTTGNFHSIPAYYNPGKHGQHFLRYQMDMAVNAMLGLCITANEYPIVRYYNSKLAKQLALTFQEKIDDYYRSHPDFEPSNSKTIFLITDRTMDMFGPLCHYSYYRSQIFDLIDGVEIPREPDVSAKYYYTARTGEGDVKKVLSFDDHDPVYMELKDLSMEDASERIKQLYNDLKAEDAKFSGRNLESAHGLRHALINKDTHAERKTLVTGHYQLSTKMWDALNKEHMGDIIIFENLCAAGLGPIDSIKTPVISGLIHLLENDRIDVYNKIRLLILYAFYRNGIIQKDLEKLLMFSMPDKAENVMKLFRNLKLMGVNLIKSDLRNNAKKSNTFFGVNDTETQMKIMVPTFSNIVSRIVYNKLSEYYTTTSIDSFGYEDELDDSLKTFPYQKGGPDPTDIDGSQAVRHQPKWKSVKSSNDNSRQKLMIFCAGGLTPSELSSITSLENELNRNIIVGTDEIYSVWDMLGDITLINETDFEFPLSQKLINKQIPQGLLENSADPNDSSPPQVEEQTKHSNIHQNALPVSSRETNLEGKNKEVSKMDSEKKKLKGMMKKFKKFSI
ncbi:hypothetical protein CANINC_002815 [Pichia inconspicua]|uniref:Uncharacterized protein n=1 Tax=Pichia inconspicua TaxID=52247 RepID=A0A4T0X066_9ASCO|nr:hypothetical protein CANINC_002815 [[Candida] inconspicua]